MKKALEAATSRAFDFFVINTLILFLPASIISYAIFLRNILCILFKMFLFLLNSLLLSLQ